MRGIAFHRDWGLAVGLPIEAVDIVFSLIDHPMKDQEYLEFLTRVTEWWDSECKEFAPIKCKTPREREKAEQKYMKNSIEFETVFFCGRTEGGDLSRVEGNIGKFQSCMQRKYIKDVKKKGPAYLRAFYLHHLLDYCTNVTERGLGAAIERQRERLAATEPEFDEAADFITRNWSAIISDIDQRQHIKSPKKRTPKTRKSGRSVPYVSKVHQRRVRSLKGL